MEKTSLVEPDDDSSNSVLDAMLSSEQCDELEEENLQDRVALFLTKLRSNSSQTLGAVNFVVDHTSSLISDVVGSRQRKSVSFLREIGHSESPGGQQLLEHFACAAQPFQGFESEYKQMQYFTQSGCFVQPEEVPLPGFSYTQQRDPSTGTVRQVAVRDTFQRVPLKPLLKQVLESPGMMEKIFEWQNQESTALEDFRDGTIFKTNELFSKELSIPLVLYNDDCEMVNPLGLKTSVHKLVSFYKTDDVKTYGINAVLDTVVCDIEDLELEGIQVETKHFKGTIKAGVAQVCGDNLGLNGILGYTTFLRENRVSMVSGTQRGFERTDSLGSVSNAQQEKCSLNKLQFYHVTYNVTPDVMHDILEGVGGYETKLVLSSLIEQKLLTLDQLNNRLTSFDYGFSDGHNKPSAIKPQDLKNPDGAIRQTAAQMWCLLRLLPLMIGDLIPEGEKHWELLLSLLSCMELIFSPALTAEAVIFLQHLIEEHHRLFLELYPDRHLKPKHHFMLHYPGAIRKLGPLVQFWCMRFEAKQGFFKRLSHVACNFHNIFGPGYTTFLGSIEDFEKVKCGFEGIPLFSDVYLPLWIKCKGTTYRSGMTLFVSHSADGEPQFATIQNIVVIDSKVKFIVKKWDTVGFDRHFFAFSVSPSSALDVVDIHSVDDHHPLHVVMSLKENENDHCISLRYRLF
ncbi:hypothetical protein ABG768_005106 [Culter alburnus]|uniref:Uncharacterized protein n=1 Tax=Culter alburnus TaxID=194366 RepID=A0AAW1ZU15_CULAL